MKIEFDPISSISNDCTQLCNVVLDGKYKVKEFVDYILKSRSEEYGEIYINNEKFEYNKGKIVVGKDILSKFANNMIDNIQSWLGWINVDYFIKVK